MRSRPYPLVNISATSFSTNSRGLIEKLLRLTRMSLSVAGQLPPGTYSVTIAFRGFEARSPPPPSFLDKNVSQPFIPPTSSEETTPTATSSSSISRKPAENPNIPRSDAPSEPSTPNQTSQTSLGLNILSSSGQSELPWISKLEERK